MDLQEKLKQLKTQLEAANKRHIDAKAEIIKIQRDVKALEKLIEKANEILNDGEGN